MCHPFPLAGGEYRHRGVCPLNTDRNGQGSFWRGFSLGHLHRWTSSCCKFFFFFFWKEYCQGWKQFRWLAISFGLFFFLNKNLKDIFILEFQRKKMTIVSLVRCCCCMPEAWGKSQSSEKSIFSIEKLQRAELHSMVCFGYSADSSRCCCLNSTQLVVSCISLQSGTLETCFHVWNEGW